MARTFSWLPEGPIQQYFKARAQNEYFRSQFGGPDEILLLVSGMLSPASTQTHAVQAQARGQRVLGNAQRDAVCPVGERRPASLVGDAAVGAGRVSGSCAAASGRSRQAGEALTRLLRPLARASLEPTLPRRSTSNVLPPPVARNVAHIAAMPARDLAHQRKPQTHAAVAFLRTGRSVERLEDALALGLRDAGPAVRHRDARTAAAERRAPTLRPASRRHSGARSPAGCGSGGAACAGRRGPTTASPLTSAPVRDASSASSASRSTSSVSIEAGRARPGGSRAAARR